MERKQNQPADRVAYELVALPAGPDPEEERFFVFHELEQISAAIKAYRKRGLLGSLMYGVDGPSLHELQHYRHKLNSYANTIDRYDLAMGQGIMPFRIAVTNVGDLKDHHISIRVKITDGTVLLTRQLPSRPLRPAGHQHAVPEEPSYNFGAMLSGFRRGGVRIGRTSLAATFSELGPGEEAALINQTLFLEMTPATVLAYDLDSEHLEGVSGLVGM